MFSITGERQPLSLKQFWDSKNIILRDGLFHTKKCLFKALFHLDYAANVSTFAFTSERIFSH